MRFGCPFALFAYEFKMLSTGMQHNLQFNEQKKRANWMPTVIKYNWTNAYMPCNKRKTRFFTLINEKIDVMRLPREKLDGENGTKAEQMRWCVANELSVGGRLRGVDNGGEKY